MPSSLKIVPYLLLAFAASCSDHVAIGQPCSVPVPCDPNNVSCGFNTSEFYLQETDRCDGNICIVYALDNGTMGKLPADPSLPCETSNSQPGCVTTAQVEQGMYCSCKCGRLDGSEAGTCRCSEGFVCAQPGVDSDFYCVRLPAGSDAQSPNPNLPAH